MKKNKTVEIAVFGIGSSSHQHLKRLLNHALKGKSISYCLKDISDVDKFIQYNIESIPSVIVDKKKIFQNNDFQSLSDMASRVSNFLTEYYSEKPISSIIVPTDFSENAKHALVFASRLGTCFEVPLRLLHVYHPAPAPDMVGVEYADPEIDEHLRSELHDYIEDMQAHARLNGYRDKNLFGDLAIGFPVEEIITYANQSFKPLIVMGSTGANHAIDHVFGTISASVARHADCPVLLIPRNTDFRPLKHIMIAADGEFLNEDALSIVEFLCNCYDSTLHLVHVGRDGGSILKKTANGFLKHNPDLEITTQLLPGPSVMKTLNSYVGQNQIDLLVMVAEKRNWLKGLFHTSLTKQMALTTSIPLLVFHGQPSK